MRKFLVAMLLLVCIGFFCAYIFIPSKIYFSEAVVIRVDRNNATRFLMDENNWKKWWPEKNNNPDSAHKVIYLYKNYSYSVDLKMLKGDSILITNNDQQIHSLLNIIPVSTDSIAVQWAGQLSTALSGFKRFENYLESKKIKNNIDDLLHSMKTFLEKEENLYGLVIDQIKVTDTLLVAKQYSSQAYPTTAEIYNLITDLKNYISKEGATETSNPMLHVNYDSGVFITMVAIPVNKILPETNNFIFRRMVPGKILTAEVKGGTHTAENAIKQIEMYMNDYHLVAPAIPFQSLVTDRSKEPDTTKWVTKIFYPVM